MNWYRDLGLTEYVLAGIFVLAYLLYLAKIRHISLVLRSSANRVFIKLSLRGTYFLLLLIALLGPAFGETKRELKTVGKDIYLAIDLSLSMNAIDIQPSRLEKIKFELKNLINNFSSDRVGLIIFASETDVQCPLTYDQSALALFLETLSTNLFPAGATTDIGLVLRTAMDRHETGNTVPNAPDKQLSKIVILVSDGEDFGEEASEAAEEMKKRGIRLYCLGIGTEEGGQIPVQRANGNESFKRDPETGREVVTKLYPQTLTDLATITGGAYFEISDKRNDTKKLADAIGKIQGELRDIKQIDTTANKYFYFLLAAFVLIFFDIMVTVKTVNI